MESGDLLKEEQRFNSVANQKQRYMPIIKRYPDDHPVEYCAVHPNKRAKFYDISDESQGLCSKCIIEKVLNCNFNNDITKEGK